MDTQAPTPIPNGTPVRFTPFNPRYSTIEGMLAETITNTSGGIGWNIFCPTPTDPHRVLRAWESDGITKPAEQGAPLAEYEAPEEDGETSSTSTSDDEGTAADPYLLNLYRDSIRTGSTLEEAAAIAVAAGSRQ